MLPALAEFQTSDPNWWLYAVCIIAQVVLTSATLIVAFAGDPVRSGRPTLAKLLLGCLLGILPAVTFWSLTGYFSVFYVLTVLVILFGFFIVSILMINMNFRGEDAQRRTSLLAHIDQGEQQALAGWLKLAQPISGVVALAGGVCTIWVGIAKPFDPPTQMMVLGLLVFSIAGLVGLINLLLTLAPQMVSEDRSDPGRVVNLTTLIGSFFMSTWQIGFPVWAFRPDLLFAEFWITIAVAGGVFALYLLCALIPFAVGRSKFAKQKKRVLAHLEKALRHAKTAQEAPAGSPTAADYAERTVSLVKSQFLDLAGRNQFLKLRAKVQSLDPAVAALQGAEIPDYAQPFDSGALSPYNRFLLDEFIGGADAAAPQTGLPSWGQIIARYADELDSLDYRYVLMARMRPIIDKAGDPTALYAESKELEHALTEIKEASKKEKSDGRPLTAAGIVGLLFINGWPLVQEAYRNEITSAIRQAGQQIQTMLPTASPTAE